MSQITTHVLDTAVGKPAEGIQISLQQPDGDKGWEDLATGITNADGRIADLLKPDRTLAPGIYRMFFQTKPYFDGRGIKTFYPFIPIIFEVTDTSHYHIPLLLNPFGYSTYRGS